MELEGEVGRRGVGSTGEIKSDSHLTSEHSHVHAAQRGGGLGRLSQAR